jgi:hypothetical protein
LEFNVAGLSMNSLAAQAFVFFVAGYETSSTSMTFCLYELSLHQDIQDRLRQEIDVVLNKHDSKLTYEGIQEMEYLDKVVSGKTQFLMNVTKTGHALLNIAMSLEHLSLLHINLQSKLKIRTNQYHTVSSARALFSSLFFFVSLISIFYTEYIPAVRICVVVSVYFTLRYILDINFFFSLRLTTVRNV